MRIAFFADSYRPHVSGVVRSMEITAHHLRDLGHHVTLVVPDHPDAPSEPEDGVLRVPSLPAVVYPSLRIGLPIHVWPGRPPVDVLHAHSPFTLGLAAVRLGARYGLPVVYTVHSLYDEYVRYLPLHGDNSPSLPGWLGGERPPAAPGAVPGLAAAAVRKYVAALLERCDRVIAPSRHVQDALAEWGVTRPIAVIPTGVDRDALLAHRDGASIRRRFAIPPEAFLWLYVGRLAPEKEVDFLLAAFSRFAAGLPARFLVVGDGPELERLREQAAELGVAERVLFPGALPFPAVAACYQAADLFTYACRVDTQGLVLAEAAAAGLPALAVACPAAIEVVRPGITGLIAPPDPGRFAALAIRYATDAVLRQSLREGCARHATFWGARESAARLTQLYQELVDPVGAPR